MNKPYLSTRTSYRRVYCLVCNHVPFSSNRVVSFATASTTSHFLLEMYILVLWLLFTWTKLWHATPPAFFIVDPWMRCQIDRLIEERCAMTFLRDRVYDVRLAGDNSAEKSPIDLTLAPNLWGHIFWPEGHRDLGLGSFDSAYHAANE